jgi:multisubunit Na+/H+ antiporter MnhB subunit
MRAPSHIVLRAAARFYTPLMALFASMLLLTRAPGTGVGFAAGLAFALVLMTHVLVYGAAAARQASPPLTARIFLALGLVVSFVGVGAPRFPLAQQLTEAGVFVTTTAGVALVLSVLVARAPAMHDEA